MKIHDLTMTLNERTEPFPDSHDPHMTWTHMVDHSSYKCQVSLLSCVTHLGTHVDAPLHYIKDGLTTAQMPLEAYVGPAVCFRFPFEEHLDERDEIDLEAFLAVHAHEIRPGERLILFCDYEKLVGTNAYFDFKNWSGNVGEELEKYDIRGIGFDMPSIDRTGDAHQAVLSRGIGIYESLVNLEPLINKHFLFSAAPLKLEDGDGSPVRAYAILDE